MVDRRSKLSFKQFLNEYILINRPVVLTDAAKGWKAHEFFTPDFFKNNFPGKEASIKGTKYSLAEYVDMMLTSTEQNPAPYPWKLDIEKKFPELIEYVQPGFEVMKKNRLKSPFFIERFIPNAATLEIFFGGPAGWFPYIHYDLYGLYAIVTQVYGRKEFILYHPSQKKFLYPDPEDPWKSIIANYHKPDYGKYPLFANAEGTSVTVHPGETVFVPKGWWHTAKSLEPTISIAQDLLVGFNWDLFSRDVVFYKRKESFLKGLAYSAFVKAAGAAMSVHEMFIEEY